MAYKNKETLLNEWADLHAELRKWEGLRHDLIAEAKKLPEGETRLKAAKLARDSSKFFTADYVTGKNTVKNIKVFIRDGKERLEQAVKLLAQLTKLLETSCYDVMDENQNIVYTEVSADVSTEELIKKLPGCGSYTVFKDSKVITYITIDKCVFEYRLKLRNVSIGTQPLGFIKSHLRTVFYPFKLLTQDVNQYDLDFRGLIPQAYKIEQLEFKNINQEVIS